MDSKLRLDALTIIDRQPTGFLRDPALFYHDNRLFCFHTTVEETQPECRRLFPELSITGDGKNWTTRRLTESPLNFSSPGNLMALDGEYILCLQSYPIPSGQLWADENCRLYLMRSRNLTDWSEPEELNIDRPTPLWSNSPRKIDPYIVRHAGCYYCLYKTEGKFGLLWSRNLKRWNEFTSEPVFSTENTPDHATVENPCVIPADDGGWLMFFSPCRPGRGIGIAKSFDLLHWTEVSYLDVPTPAWAGNGISAAMVLDLRAEFGVYLMGFHGETEENSHKAALGFARSSDLRRWQLI